MSEQLFTTGNTKLEITDASVGVDREGMMVYVQELRVNILDKIVNDLKNVGEIQTAVDAAWTGKSKDRFLQAFDGSINGVIIDINAEFEDLCYRLDDLKNSFAKMDQSLSEDY